MKTLVLTATLLLAGAATEAAPATATTADATAYQRGMFSATNHQRAAHDRASFHHQSCVQRYAERQAKRMAAQQRIFHQDLGRVLRACDLHAAGENVASGFSTGRAVVRAWMHSAGHRANILDRDYRLLGVGARLGDDGLWYAVQVFGGR